MAYTVRTLIIDAFYLSGVVARELQTVSGQQEADGLSLLNQLLAVKTANERLIPYYGQTGETIYTINEITGQEMYYIENLIDVSSATFNIGPVRYPMAWVPRRDYFGQARVDNIQALSFSYHNERTLGGTNFFVYFLPQGPYPLNIVGKFSLGQVTINQDLEESFDLFYIAYLRYALAQYICEDYNLPFQPNAQQKLNEYESMLMDISPLDLSMTKTSCFSSTGGLNWGDVNIGRGWRP